MGWLMKLYQTYENCQGEIGRETYQGGDVGNLEESKTLTPLLPVAHTTMNAHIQITIDEKAQCIGAEVITDKKERSTIIPCTEESLSRSGKAPVHHPLFDKLQYLAGDYEKYGGEKGGKFHEAYMEDLKKWCGSSHANRKVQLIYEYLKKGTLIEDLVRYNVLVCDDNGKLKEKWDGQRTEIPEIFKAAGDQFSAAARIEVSLEGEETKIWKDPEAMQDYIDYYTENMGQTSLCFASGEEMPCSALHPKKLVPFEANAKLISTNDSQGFTFRGRINDASQAQALSYVVSQKAHNALRWLVEKQGYCLDNQCFLTWGTENELLPPVMGSSADLVRIYEEHDESVSWTGEDFSRRFQHAMAGYHAELGDHSEIVMMGMMAATPGRLSVTFYREFSGADFLRRIKKWHEECCWRHAYFHNGQRQTFVGAPAPKDIVLAGYGAACNDKLKKYLLERILQCIASGGRLPADIMQNAVRRASNLTAIKEGWEREKTLTVACALYRKYCFDIGKKEKEVPDLPLNHDERDRSYLYGRLLAVANYLEQRSFDKWNERETNAYRYQRALSIRPAKTWARIRENLQAYEKKLTRKNPAALAHCRKLFMEIDDLFLQGDYMREEPLSPYYLNAFDCQMSELIGWNKGDTENQEEPAE